jgi:anti-sigma factor RsiW
MNIKREVILDLLPVYISGEASPATCALVEEHARQDPEIAHRIQALRADDLVGAPLPALPPELELRALYRTRRLLALQRWLFGFGICFTAISLSSKFSFRDGRLSEVHFLIRDYPVQFGAFVILALICWIAYFFIRRRLRTAPL